MTEQLVQLAGADDQEQDDRGPLPVDDDHSSTAAEPSADPVHFEEAVRAFRARVPMTDAQYRGLAVELRGRAFTIAGVAQLDVVADVWAALDEAVAKGTTFAEFKATVGDALTKAWGKADSSRLDNIFRTGTQRAYGAGSVRQLQAPAVLARRPFWKYLAVLDGRTSPICRALAGLTLPASDPAWNSRKPPLHFRCRGKLVPLTAAQAEAEGITTKAPTATAQEGFGDPEAVWMPDLSKYPPELAAAYRAKLKDLP